MIIFLYNFRGLRVLELYPSTVTNPSATMLLQLLQTNDTLFRMTSDPHHRFSAACYGKKFGPKGYGYGGGAGTLTYTR